MNSQWIYSEFENIDFELFSSIAGEVVGTDDYEITQTEREAEYDADISITLNGSNQQIAVEIKNRFNIYSNTTYKIDDFKEFNLDYSKYKTLEAIACNRPTYLLVIYPTDKKALVWKIDKNTRYYPNVQVEVPKYTLTNSEKEVRWQKQFPLERARVINIPIHAIDKMRSQIRDLRKRIKENKDLK